MTSADIPMRSGVLLPVALVSAGALGYEVLLTRLFAIIQWHHFAYMVISLALLGFGASGTLLCIAGARWARRFPLSFTVNAALFCVTSVAGFLVAQRIDFNPLELAWTGAQTGRLLLIDLVLLVPFIFAANAIGLALMAFAARAPRVYAWDLVGAGAGAAGMVGALFLIPPEAALLLPAASGAAAAAFAAPGKRGVKSAAAVGVVALIGAAYLAAPAELVRLRPSEFKPLAQALQVAGAKLAVTRDSPLGRLAAVENQTIPLRDAPGLSIVAGAPIPPQVALYVDGDGPAAITRFDGERRSVRYLDQVTSALPYHLVRSPAVLAVGAGGGADVLQAIYQGAETIDVVELNPQIIDIVRRRYGEFAGRIYDRENVRVFIEEARGFAEKTDARYGVIQISIAGSLVAAGSGLSALSANYLTTVEGMSALLARLEPGGVLAFTRWLRLPPRDGLKLFATAVTALEAAGISDPGKCLAWIRSFGTSTLVVKKGMLSAADVSALRAFAGARGFDLVWYPGIRAVEANRFNRLEQPYFHEAAKAILSNERRNFIERYKFDIRPATDDRPYFDDFFKLAHAGEILGLRARGGMGLLDLGHLVVWATLVQAVVLSVVLILLPLWIFRVRGEAPPRRAFTRAAVLGYFLCVGFGFIFIEIVFIQKLLLFLNHPLYAVAVVLAGFLLFAGAGSRFAARLSGRDVAARILLPVILIVVAGGIYLELLPRLSGTLMMLSDPLRVLSALLLIAPIAFFMGMPFPVAVEALGRRDPALVPWAWGANGCASVTGAVLATLLAAGYGGAVVVLIALLLYFAAGATGLVAFRNAMSDGAA